MIVKSRTKVDSDIDITEDAPANASATDADHDGTERDSNADGVAESASEDVEGGADKVEASSEEVPVPPAGPRRRVNWRRVLVLGVLPGLAMLIALGAGYMKWQYVSSSNVSDARIASVQAARDTTTAMLAYKPDTVEQQLTAAQDRLTGSFRDAYGSLTRDVVIPGAKQQGISTTVDIPTAASVSASTDHAVVLVFVNQTAIVGNDEPSTSATSVRVTLDRVDGRWLVSGFDPI
jgi:Mce-associated membrane protein